MSDLIIGVAIGLVISIIPLLIFTIWYKTIGPGGSNKKK